jgi:DNA-binding PadR family transcriptional regulator
VRELSPTEWAVLGLLSRRPQHGFALAKSLSAGGEFGHVWTVRRPLVYRALDTLHADGLIAFRGAEPGDGGPPRRSTVITAKGRAALRNWLAEPVVHVRDARSLLLLKLVILDELALDPTALVESQVEVVKAIAQGLELQISQATRDGKRTVLLFRLETVRGLQRFLDQRAGATMARRSESDQIRSSRAPAESEPTGSSAAL